MIGNIHRFDRPGPHITLMGATNRALTFRARGGGCFAPQISGWNDSVGEPLALVFAQEHGAGLEAWQTRTRRGDSDSVNLGSNPGPPARQSGLRGFISPLGRIADIPVGYAGRSQSLVGNFPYFGPCEAGFGRRSLVAIFQFPFRRGGDRFDCRQRPVRRGPLESQADAGTKSTASVDSLADIRCVS